MKVAVPCLVSTLLLAAGVVAAANGGKSPSSPASYRWVDERGNVHYGDRVPPEAARREREILNSQGVVIERLEAEKTPEQLAEDERRRAELARQRQHDQFLLTTYTSVKDIEALRDLRLDQLQGQVRGAELYIESLESRLRVLQARALGFKPYSERPDARRMPDDLAEEIVRALNETRSQRRLLEAKRSEQSTLREQFQADIDRYRELRTLHTTMR